MKYKYFSYCPEDGFDTHETLEDALLNANGIIPNYLDEGWSEDVTGVFVGTITHAATMCDKVERVGSVDEDGYDDEGTYWDPDCDYKCDYKMLPVEIDANQNPVGWVVVGPGGCMSDIQTDHCHAVDLKSDMDSELPPHHAGPAHEVKPLYLHPQQTQETSRNESFAFRADGEANFYTVSERGGNWTARIQFNGEFMCDEQERMTAVITDALADYRQKGGE